jgi:polysaccharide export outer membrane protein
VAPRSIEQQLTDTFTVGAERTLILPTIGLVTLQGVLRAELEAHLAREIGRFIREPVLYARPLIRVSVQGDVARPGFYSLPVDAVLSDALMAAGGPTQQAQLAKLRIERNGTPIWSGPLLRQAVAEGRTLDDMDLRAGDQFAVPGRARPENTLRIIGLVLSIPVTIFTLTRVL